MAGRGIDVLTIVGPDDQILAAPHNRGTVGEAAPELRALAAVGEAWSTASARSWARSDQTVLVAETARVAKDGPYTVVVAVGRAIDARLVTAVRRAGQIDTRVVDAAAASWRRRPSPGGPPRPASGCGSRWPPTAPRWPRGSRCWCAIAT
jgi:hypothetical protein